MWRLVEGSAALPLREGILPSSLVSTAGWGARWRWGGALSLQQGATRPALCNASQVRRCEQARAALRGVVGHTTKPACTLYPCRRGQPGARRAAPGAAAGAAREGGAPGAAGAQAFSAGAQRSATGEAGATGGPPCGPAAGAARPAGSRRSSERRQGGVPTRGQPGQGGERR